MRSLAFALTLLSVSTVDAFSLISTYGMGVNEDESLALRAAQRQARDRCMQQNGAVRRDHVIDVQLVELPDTHYSTGGEVWVARVEARCLVL